MRSKVFVVEGRNDASRLRQIYPDIQIITTNGSAMDVENVEVIRKLDETHDIILFLDPDHAGERIRRLLGKTLKHAYHAFLDQEVARSKNGKKVGIEHASKEVIEKALLNLKDINEDSKSDITHNFLFEMGLTGSVNSKNNRKILAQALHIGYTNGKTLYHRLRMFGITKDKVIEVMRESSS